MTKKKPRTFSLPEQPALSALLHYNRETGHLYYKIQQYGKNAGDSAERTNFYGDRVVRIGGKYYPSHRIIWKLEYGVDPEATLIRLDGDKQNNRLENFLLAPKYSGGKTSEEKNKLPDYLTIKALFDYDPVSGVLSWKLKSRKPYAIGKPAGGKGAGGYLDIAIEDHKYRAHRIIWKWMTGEDPLSIDHIDGNRTNNAWHNLRSVEHHVNLKNSKLSKSNTSGAVGVWWNEAQGKWNSYITYRGRRKHLGSFDTFEEAVAARKAADAKYGFHENHGRKTG